MRRIKALGLCLVAVFAFSVVLAASAQAAKETAGPLDIASHGGAAHLGTELGVELKSTHNIGKGTFESATTGFARATFYEVTTTTGGNCNNVAGETNTVKTELLSEEVNYINKGAEEVGDSFKGKNPGGLSAVFSCEGLGQVNVKGSVIGIITSPAVNHPSKTGTLALKGVGGFKQEPESFENMPKDTLESSFQNVNGGVFTPSAQFQEDETENHGNGTVCKVKIKKGVESEKCKSGFSEVNTLAAAQPEIGRCVKDKGGKFQEANCAILSTEAGKGKFEFKPAEPGANAKGYAEGEI
jgi:hypothetical protein